MAAYPPSFDASVNAWNDDEGEHTPLKPLSGPGTTRQTRRLQLRNANFKAAAVPTRKVTPKSVSTSTDWSQVSGILSASDAENMSPSVGATGSLKVDRRRSSGILQEIGNATITRSKRRATPGRVMSAKMFGPDTSNYNEVYADDPMSPPVTKSAIRPRTVKARTKVSQKRRSVSGEARMYIDHLEAELASAQAQLASMNSPTVTREQTSKMRTLDAHTRQLQEELAEWEAKYEQRVQEVVDSHFEIEAELRTHIRTLEQDAEETRYRVQVLEAQIDESRQSVEAAEAANVQLEKRLEIMSEILATSPTKLDLHTETQGIPRRHQRPKSMLPRFPTASSLMASPERQPQTQPTSPLFSFSHITATAVQDSLDRARLVLDTSHSHSDLLSEADSVFSDTRAHGLGDSVSSIDHPLDSTAHGFNPWTLQALQSAKTRPARRMRRFGAGSMGPKPLILPSTSHCDYMPASAPPLERSETTPAFAFPTLHHNDLAEEEESPSSLVVRRRASTTADETTLAHLEASPFLRLPSCGGGGEDLDDSMLSVRCPLSAESQATTRDFSSMGSKVGRNLMDELCAVRTEEVTECTEQLLVIDDARSKVSGDKSAGTDVEIEDGTMVYGKEAEEGANVHSILSAEMNFVPGAGESGSVNYGQQRPRSLSKSQRRSTSHSLSAWDRLRTLFGSLWRSPIALARHLVQTAQARMRIPESLRNVQWWLVGVLLGPMARRRMLASTCCGEDSERRPLLEAYSPPQHDNDEVRQEEGMAYGTMYQTPDASPSRVKSAGTISGKGKKRTGSSQQTTSLDRVQGGCSRCGKQDRKHTPFMWLKFSLTLAFAVGLAFTDGPGSLLKGMVCGCKSRRRHTIDQEEVC